MAFSKLNKKKPELSEPLVAGRKRPHPVDVAVGLRVKAARVMKGMSQEGLGEALGITFQQVQKYEKGTNRISASRLVGIARTVEQPVVYFFADVDSPIGDGQHSPLDNVDANTIRLLRHFARIKDARIRRMVSEMVAIFAGIPSDEIEDG